MIRISELDSCTTNILLSNTNAIDNTIHCPQREQENKKGCAEYICKKLINTAICPDIQICNHR